MKRLRIMEAWNEFSRDVMPPNAGEIQIVETRRSFFAGAVAMFGIVTNSPDIIGQSDEDGAKVLEEINAEILLYAERLKAGAV